MKTRELSKNLLAVLLSLTVFLLASEVLLRVYFGFSTHYDVEMADYAARLKRTSPNPKIGHVHRASKSAHLMDVPVEINSDGFRDKEYPVARTDARRLVFLGDSLTFGWGVEKDATFESLLEERFSEDRPTEIINFGTGNYNTEQQVHLFLEKGPKYQPDMVVVFFFINDAEVTPQRSEWSFLGSSRLFTFLWSRIGSALGRSLSSQSFSTYYAGLYRDDQPGWINAKSAFLKLRDTCRDNGISLRVVLLPELHELSDYPFAEEYRKVSDYLDSLGIENLDLTRFFATEENPMRLWVALDDAHPNAIAHQQIADYSAPFISGGLDVH